METAQFQAHASHCVITRVPVETINQILRCTNISTGDLAAVAGTCRYLRAIATPLLFSMIKLVANTAESFAPLQAVACAQEKGPLVRVVAIDDPDDVILSSEALIYSGILVSALGVMSSLTTLAIPFATFDRAVFDAIYAVESLVNFRLGPIHGPQSVFNLASRTPFACARTAPLVAHLAESRDLTAAPSVPLSFAHLSDLLGFFDFHGVKVETVILGTFYFGPPPNEFLTAQAFSNVVDLTIGCLPDLFAQMIGWLTRVMAAQKALETFTLEVVDITGFELGRRTWAGWAGGQAILPLPELEAAWAGVLVNRLTLTFLRKEPTEEDPVDDGFMPIEVALSLLGATVISPRQVRALVENEPCSYSFSFGCRSPRMCIGWSDWSSTVSAFRSHELSNTLFFYTSVTPTTTIQTTVACSSACYATLLESHPALHAATELVGGPGALWTLAVNINIERIKMLSALDQYIVPDVYLVVMGKTQDLVDVLGTLGESRNAAYGEPVKWEVVDTTSQRTIEEKLLDCKCFICDPGVAEDPILAIRRCGVKEVRAVLAIGGFDLAAFDKRPPTEPINPDSFETFLRTTT